MKTSRQEQARQEWSDYLILSPEDRPFIIDATTKPVQGIKKGRGPIYSMIGLTKECQETTRQYQAQVAAFVEAHPDYCQTCGGWGGHGSPGCFVPYGSTYVSLPYEWDPCPDCLDQGLCPHCGQLLDNPDEPSHCSACGWDEDKAEGIPEGPGCLCPTSYLDWKDVEWFEA